MRRAPTLSAELLALELVRGSAPGSDSGGHRSPGGSDDGPARALLAAAAEMLARHGLRGWTVEDVARRAGVGRATAYRRFADRDRLVHATLVGQARAFFATVAAAVEHEATLEDKVVRGLAVGLRLMAASPLGGLLEHDQPAALSVLRSPLVLAAGRHALVERYLAMAAPAAGRSPSPPGEAHPAGPDREQAEAVAEALLRLGLSLLLIPSDRFDPADDAATERSLRRLVAPLLSGPPTPPAPRRPGRSR